MAKNLARIMCTEEDKVNCPFYFKNGACRYGDKCTRRHLKPSISQTLLFPRLYDNPPVAIAMAEGHQVPEDQMYQALRHFQEFYNEIFEELSKYGEIEEMFVCDNIGDHLVGNVYVKFATEEDADNCKTKITGRRYDGKMVVPEFCPVTDFREGRCRQFEDGACGRGGYCNFMHIKYVPKQFKKALFKQMYKDHPEFKKRHKERKAAAKDDEGGPPERRERSKSGDRRDKRERPRKEKSDRRISKRERSRSRSGDRKNKKHSSKRRKLSKSGSEDNDRKMMNMTSAERRAMIASWNDAGEDDDDNEKQNSNDEGQNRFMDGGTQNFMDGGTQNFMDGGTQNFMDGGTQNFMGDVTDGDLMAKLNMLKSQKEEAAIRDTDDSHFRGELE